MKKKETLKSLQRKVDHHRQNAKFLTRHLNAEKAARRYAVRILREIITNLGKRA